MTLLLQLAERVFQDFTKCWPMVLIGLAAAMLVSLVWILMMRFIAGFMVWLSILAALALQAVGELARSWEGDQLINCSLSLRRHLVLLHKVRGIERQGECPTESGWSVHHQPELVSRAAWNMARLFGHAGHLDGHHVAHPNLLAQPHPHRHRPHQLRKQVMSHVSFLSTVGQTHRSGNAGLSAI